MTPQEQKELAEWAEIKLRDGNKVKVDREDFDKLNAFQWSSLSGYAVRYDPETRKTIRMHRVINDTPKNMETDHINGDRLDNRKSNLRTVSRSQNVQNGPPRGGKSKYIGVTWNEKNKKWRSQICVNYKRINLGLFALEEEAALAYNSSALQHFGENAKINEL